MKAGTHIFWGLSGLLVLLLGWQITTSMQPARHAGAPMAYEGRGLRFPIDPLSISPQTVIGPRVAGKGFAWKSGYDILVKDGTLVVRVAVNLVPSRGVTLMDLKRVKPAWRAGIQRVWNRRFALQTASGRRYPIVIEASFKGPRFHHDVIVRPGAGRTDELNWNLLDSPELVAHEFGHMLGLYDEYPGGALAPHGAIIDAGSIMSSNPGRKAVARKRHYEPFRKWFMEKTQMNNVRIIHEKTTPE